MAGKVIAWFIRLAVAGVFLAAGVLKIWDFRHGRSATPDFDIVIQHFKLLPTPDLALLFAVYLPWLEITTAITLFVRRVALGAAMAATAMTVVFLAAIGSAWARGLDISCGCFGKNEVAVSYPMLVLRDVALLGGALVLLALEWRRTARPGSLNTP